MVARGPAVGLWLPIVNGAPALRRRQFLAAGIGVASFALFNGHGHAQSRGAALPEVQAATLDGSVRLLPGGAIKDLRDALHGALLLPRDDGYDDARRLANRQFDKHPALIVQATGAEDVRQAVNFARQNNLLLAVKGGGHSDFGVSSSDGGMMLDLSPMRSVRIDTGAKRAWVSGATLAGLIDHETVPQGLVVPLGGNATVGIGGLATGGGIGKLSRRFGLTLDSIRAVDMVTADGNFLHASPAENPDLFWAVRGGGGNFGVVTDLEFELHPIPARVVAGTVAFPFSQLREVLSAYGDYGSSAPDELYLECFIAARATSETSILQLGVCYSGDTANAERVLEPIRRFGKVIRDDLKAVSYLVAQGADSHPAARTGAVPLPDLDVFFRGAFLEGLDRGFVATLAERLAPRRLHRINMLFLPMGGAIARVPSAATPFARRSASHDMIFVTSWPRVAGEAEQRAYSRRLWDELRPHTSGFYINDMAGGVTPDAVAANFGSNYSRLARVKATYDPHNLFRLNANILPRRG